MLPTVVLERTDIEVEPGGRATVTARILNPSQIVEGYTVEVVGEPAAFALVLPAEVSAFPGQEATVEIAFDPPASAKVAAGPVAFGVRVRSRTDPDISTVVEGTLRVGGFRNVNATIGPRTSRGRRKGTHRVEVSNWGNEAVELDLVPDDPDERLRLSVRPSYLEVPIGGAAAATVTVRSRQSLWRGAPVRLPFTVSVRESGRSPDDTTAFERTLDASYEQRPLIPGWVFALGALAVVVAALAVYLRPESDAESASQEATPGGPATPADFAVASDGEAGITTTWTPVDGVTGYELLRVDPATKDADVPTVNGTIAVPSAQNAQLVEDDLEPGVEACFRIVAISDAGRSAPSPVQCAVAPEGAGGAGGDGEGDTTTTAAGTVGPDGPGGTGDDASTTTAGGGTGEPGPAESEELGFVAVLDAAPLGDAGATTRAQNAQQLFTAQGFTVEVLNSLDHTGLPDGPDGDGFLEVAVVGFETQAEASQFCEDNREQLTGGCLVLEPAGPDPTA